MTGLNLEMGVGDAAVHLALMALLVTAVQAFFMWLDWSGGPMEPGSGERGFAVGLAVCFTGFVFGVGMLIFGALKIVRSLWMAL